MVDRWIPLPGSLATVAGLLPLSVAAQDAVAPQRVRELGTVRFARDLDAVLAEKPAKPLFLLFQEIPG